MKIMFDNVVVKKGVYKNGAEFKHFYINDVYADCNDIFALPRTTEEILYNECANYICAVRSRKGTIFYLYYDVECCDVLCCKKGD